MADPHSPFPFQVLLNMLEFGMNPQEALDAPRFCITPPSTVSGSETTGGVALEEGISDSVVEALRTLGHCVIGPPVTGHGRRLFGRGQIIIPRPVDGRTVWWAGSDGRGDGQAVGY